MKALAGYTNFSIKFEPAQPENTITVHKPRRRRSALLTFLLLFLVGCGTPGYIKAEAIEATVLGLVERHDAYVDADDSLLPLEKRAFKRDGDLLKILFAEAKQPTEPEEEE